MSIKEIFEQATGREAIVQDGLTTDTTYKVGEISRKTGLQKQPDGSWAPPKGAQKAPAKKEEVRSAEERQAWASMNGFKNEEEMKKAEKDALEFERKFKAGEIDAEGNPKQPAVSQDPKRTDNTTGKDYKAGQTVPQAAAMQETMAHREKQAMQAYSKLKQEGASSDETYAAAQLVRSSRDLGELLRVIAKDPEDPLNEATAEKLNGMLKEHDQLQKEVDNIKSRRTINTKNTTGGIEGKLSGDYLQDYKQLKSSSGKDLDKAIQAGAIEYQKSHPGASEGAALEFAVGNLNRLRDSYVRQDKSFKNVTEEELASAATGKPAASSETDPITTAHNEKANLEKGLKNQSMPAMAETLENTGFESEGVKKINGTDMETFKKDYGNVVAVAVTWQNNGHTGSAVRVFNKGQEKAPTGVMHNLNIHGVIWDSDYTAESINAPREKMERTLTKDTKIRLTQIQRETQDARRTYKVGEISEKTGLQKQPNGTWAPPKNAAPAASEKKVVHTPGGEPYKPGSLYKTDPAKLAEQARKEGNAKKAEFYEAEAKKEAGSSEAKPAHEPPKVHSNGKTWRRSNWSTFSNGAIVTNPGYAASMTTQELKKEQSRRQEFYNEEKAKGKLEPHDAEAIEKSLETINKELSKRTTPKLEKDGFEIKIPKAKTSAGGFGANTTAYIKRGDKYYKQEMMAGDWMGLERATQEEFENAEHDENSHFSTSSINTLVNTSKRRLGIQDSAPTLASIFESVKK